MDVPEDRDRALSPFRWGLTIMNRLLWLPLLILVSSVWLMSGCSFTYPVVFGSETTRGDTVTVGTMNRRLENRSATIITRDGKELSATNVFLRRDSCLFTGATAQSSLPTADIVAVRRVEHFSSTVGGFGLGLLGGFVVGVGVAYVAVDRSSGDSRMGAGLLGIGLTAFGAIAGTVAGAVHGTVSDYMMPGAAPDSSLRQTQ